MVFFLHHSLFYLHIGMERSCSTRFHIPKRIRLPDLSNQHRSPRSSSVSGGQPISTMSMNKVVLRTAFSPWYQVREEDRLIAEQAMEKMRIREYAPKPYSQLSGGQQQLVAVARAMAANPSHLLLDEPTEGLAPIIVEEMARDVVRTCTEQKVALLL
ncbi:MAG: ATP-binding cassette domain-containing protein, partial [Desulfobulbus sp.]|nr:ATP-binding cassette domain-containing protein [Desulfobulbus sp.]